MPETEAGSPAKVSSPASLSHSSLVAGLDLDQAATASANLLQHDYQPLQNNDDGGRTNEQADGADNEMEGMTESTATFTLDDEDNSLDELTEGLETRADDDDEFRDVVSHVQDKVSQIMGANLTNVSACMRHPLPV